ncbi:MULTISPECIES: hypothetical protein [unclassified Helicobacter]|uniref:hypothetical protein n=1 Tax=unclassified Helicobacter TaxID=2593540 RepID=UPI0013155FE3|nr:MULTISPECIES: hypothetical protein [unclassified Helicobacter]
MQEFSSMSRNSSVKNIIANVILLVVFVCYLSLSSIYVIFPPLLGILFAKYIRDCREANFFGMFIVLLLCVFFELEKSNMIGPLYLLFLFLSYVVSKTALILQETTRMFRLIYVFLPYIFYFFILQSLTIINHQPPIPFNALVLWYLFCESVIILWKK